MRSVTRAYTRQHGEPMVRGERRVAALGLEGKIKMKEVDFGEWREPRECDIPIFCGCGVTRELAVQVA